jgi:glycosyltransferase involved in cell wall biosynthesis
MIINLYSQCNADPKYGSGFVITQTAQAFAELHQVRIYTPKQLLLKPSVAIARSYRIALAILIRGLWNVMLHPSSKVLAMGGSTWALVLVLWMIGQKNKVVHYSNGLEPKFASRLIHEFGTTRLDGKPMRLYEKLWRWLEIRSFLCAGLVVTISPAEERWARQHLGLKRIRTILNPVSSEFYFSENKKKQIVFASSWLKSKGSSFMPSIIRHILASHPAWYFKIVGQVPEDLASDRVELLPLLEKQQLADLFRQSAIVLAPTVSESFHLIVVEALICGCRVVTNREGIAVGLDCVELADFNENSLIEHLEKAISRFQESGPVSRDWSAFSIEHHKQEVQSLFAS